VDTPPGPHASRMLGLHRGAIISSGDIHSEKTIRRGPSRGGAARPPSRWWRNRTGLLRRVLVLTSRHARPVGRAAQSVEAGVILIRRVREVLPVPAIDLR